MAMNKEQQYLLTLCRAYLYSERITLREDIDYEKLYVLAKSHNLTAICFCVIKNCANKAIVDAGLYKKFEDVFFETVFRFEEQTKIIEDIRSLLTAADCDFVLFKGSEIRNYFPVAQARAMGDIDVLIPQDKRDSVKNLLCKNGYKIKNSNGPVYDYVKSNTLIEVHTKIVSGKVGNSNAEKFFENAIEHICKNDRHTLEKNYNFAYLLTHIAHHFWFYGAGIKMILDLAVLQKKYSISFDTVLGYMEEIGLADFSKVILTVCYKWFGVGKDFGCSTQNAEQFLVSFGAFGNLNRNKAAVAQRKELESGKNTSKAKTALHLLFPPYDKIKNIPYIRFIENRPWLLPAAWIYRILYNIIHRNKLVSDVASGLAKQETSEQAEYELKFFEEIGLL